MSELKINKAPKKSWWKTDCPYCQRIRVMVLWAIIMYLFFIFIWL
jgi:hypothetical protein